MQLLFWDIKQIHINKVIAECIGAPVVMIRALISIHTLGALIRRKR